MRNRLDTAPVRPKGLDSGIAKIYPSRMRLMLCGLFSLTLSGAMYAQFAGLTLPPSGKNQRASVTQSIGPVQVSVDYSSPAVHGPDGKDRRGQIWGKLVPYGMSDLGFGNGKPGPWRAGANENTVFTTSHDVQIGDKTLPAGRYGLHMIPGPESWTVIFSKNANAWGSFFYDESEDALRVTAKPHTHDYREWLTYEFVTRKPDEATMELQWEELAVPLTIKVSDANSIYISRLKQELNGVPGFTYQGYVVAAMFCLNNNTNLDQGLKWADAAISMPGVGESNFNTLSTKALILTKMGREAEAAPIMKTALNSPTATPLQIHQYGRQLLAAKKVKEALEVFELNAQRNGDTWPVHVGLARGYSASGETAKALEHAKKALAQAPDTPNRQSLENMVQTLSEGKPINQ
jgi:hypothetical protein